MDRSSFRVIYIIFIVFRLATRRRRIVGLLGKTKTKQQHFKLLLHSQCCLLFGLKRELQNYKTTPSIGNTNRKKKKKNMNSLNI